MGSNDTAQQNTVLSRLPVWLGGIIGSSGSGTGKRKAASGEPGVVDDLVAENGVAPGQAGDIESVIDEMLSQNRYALLLRPQLINNLSEKQLARTRTALSEGMCLIPEGQVVLKRGGAPAGNADAGSGRSLRVDSFYLDRYPVTNAQFYQFVGSGGYEQMAIWDPEIWPALLDYVDATGHPGPRHWRDGRFARGEEHHPVVGVSWYEAVAYARWIGKRLPTGAEWVKAGSWPVAIQGHPLLFRRYPWGEAMDRGRANLWGSGPGRTVSVFEFPSGVSVGGNHQLIGNVWEWMADDHATDADGAAAREVKLKGIRGGAFDTYLDSQATCHFESGEVALARKHNVGFRCAIGLCDVAARHEEEDDASGDDETIETSCGEDQ